MVREEEANAEEKELIKQHFEVDDTMMMTTTQKQQDEVRNLLIQPRLINLKMKKKN